jgi:hypothetical protein
MKRCISILVLIIVCFLSFSDSKEKELTQAHFTGCLGIQSPFVLSPLLTIPLTPYEEEEITEDAGNKDNPLLHITFTYILPVSYFTLSILCKESFYSDIPGDNPLYYVNPVLTSVMSFGGVGFFGGIAIGVIATMDDGFLESFVYGTVLGVLLGITGLIAGGIYALMEYDSITGDDLFYYGAPAMVILIPVFDILRILIDD